MPLSDIRTAIKTALEGVTNVGVVTDWEPLVTRREDFLTYFKHASLAYMQGWTITRESTQEQMRNTARTNNRTHVMVIRGYRAIDNAGATEKTFQDLVETICNTLRAKENDHLDNSAITPGPPSVRICEPRSFAGYLVHYVEIVYPVTEPKTF